MKKLMILAISAMLVANVSAQEATCEGKGKQLSKEERVELDIKRFTHELMLSDKQAEKFAVTFREYAAKMNELFEKGKPEKIEPGQELTDEQMDKMAKARFEGQKKMAELQEKYYTKFRKDLSARQVAKVLRLNEGCCAGPKPCCGKEGKGQGPCDGKGHGKIEGKHKPHAPRPEGPREPKEAK